MRERWRSLAGAALLVAVVLWFFHETVFYGFSLVPTDLLHQLILPYGAHVAHVNVKNHYVIDALTAEYPWGVFWQRCVRSGELPLWNPYILGGNPHLALSMPAVLNPLKALYLFLDAERACSLGIVAAFLLVAVLMFAFLRELGRSRCEAFVSGCAFALNSSLLMWYWHAPGVFIWAPLALLLYERSIRHDSAGYALTAGLALGVGFASGNIQSAFHLGFLCGAYFVWGVVAAEPARRTTALARGGLVLLVAVLIGAVQWLPTLQLMALDACGSVTARGPQPGLRHTLLGIPLLVGLVFPQLSGSTESFDLLKLAGAARHEFTGYIGAVPFMLFMVGAFASREWRVRGLLATIAAVLLIVFFTPLLRFVYHRFFIVAVFAATVIAAYGCDILLDPSLAARRAVGRTVWGMAGACALLAMGLVVAEWVVRANRDTLAAAAQRYIAARGASFPFGYKPEWLVERVGLFFDHFRLSNVSFWLPLGSVVCVAATWRLFCRQRIRRAILCCAVVGLSAADLCMLGRQIMPQIDLREYPLLPIHPTLAVVQRDGGLFRVDRCGPHAEFIYRPNWLMAWGIQDLSGNYSLAPENVRQLFPYTGTNCQYNSLLDLANVKYLFTEDGDALPPGRFELMAQADGLRTYRNKNCLPRLQFYGHWEVIPDRQRMLALMTTDSFNSRETVFLEQSPSITPSPSKASATIEVERFTANHVTVRVTAAQGGILLLADAWYPGWKVQVDGRHAPLYRADHMLRATEVPAGAHVVEFRFAPTAFYAGALISGVTLITCLGVLLGRARFSDARQPRGRSVD